VDSHNGGKPGSEIHPTLNADAIGDKFLNNRSAGRSFSGLGQTGSRFSYPDTQTWFAGWRFYPADFNGDGRPDLLLHEQQTGTFFVATANASGFTYQQGSWPVGWMPVVADLNADGYDDLVLHDPDTGEWFEVISDGAGGFTSALVSCSYVNGTQAAGLTIVAQPAIR
jgi:hypothetical protein